MSAGIHLTNVSFSFEFYVDVHVLLHQKMRIMTSLINFMNEYLKNIMSDE